MTNTDKKRLIPFQGQTKYMIKEQTTPKDLSKLGRAIFPVLLFSIKQKEDIRLRNSSFWFNP